MLRRLYDWVLDKAGHPYAAWWLAFFAFADGGLFPFPPHPLLALMCLSQPQKALRYAAITTLASIAGGVFGYFVGHFLYDVVGQQLLHLLGLTRKFPVAACYLRAYGVEIIVLKGATPIPFLLLTVTAGFINFPLAKFVLASLLSRGAIFFGIGVLFKVFGPPIKTFVDKYFMWIVVATLIVIAGLFYVIDFAGSSQHPGDKCAVGAVNPNYA
ncbi:MAG: DedA family protein [Porphyrobacter sp.]|nr:DedA family protein [Porphyrobacter sp.]